jgi:hypothetical protein
MVYRKSLLVKEEEATIDSRIKAINTAQRIREAREIIETEEYTASKEYKELQRSPQFATPLKRSDNHSSNRKH